MTLNSQQSCGSQCENPNTDDNNLDLDVLGTISSATSNKRAWYTRICVGYQETPFKLDKGAEVTAVSRETLYMQAGYTTDAATR